MAARVPPAHGRCLDVASSPAAGNKKALTIMRAFSKLPNTSSSTNFESGYVIDLGKARKRLRPKRLEPPTVVKRLAQAEEWQRQIDAGEVNHRAEISHREGVSRARVTQIMHLLRLHPYLLDYVGSLGPETPERMVTERMLRPLSAIPSHQQVEVARFRLPGFAEFADHERGLAASDHKRLTDHVEHAACIKAKA